MVQDPAAAIRNLRAGNPITQPTEVPVMLRVAYLDYKMVRNGTFCPEQIVLIIAKPTMRAKAKAFCQT